MSWRNYHKLRKTLKKNLFIICHCFGYFFQQCFITGGNVFQENDQIA